MEFASEMIIKAKLAKLKVKSLPTNYYKDKRDKKSNLRTVKDGFRHLNLINKLKFDNSIIFRYSFVFIITLLILCNLLFLSALIPQKKIYNNTLKSYNYYYKNLKIGYLNNTNLEKDYYRIDYAADIKSLSMAYLIDEKHPIISSIEMNYYPEIDYGFRDYSKMLKENHKIENYSRYWQGQTIFLRVLLIFTDIQKIYYIFIILFFIILLILFIKLFKISKIFFICFFLSTIVINAFIVPFCYEYIFSFLIAFIGSLLVLSMLKIKKNNFDILFLVLGMCTCFFDFLTCETVTLTLPLLLYSYLNMIKSKKNNIREIFKYIILWLLGFIFMFSIKWIIDCIYFGGDFYRVIFNKASIRIVNLNENILKINIINFLKTIRCLFPLNKMKYSLTITVSIILFMIYYFIFYIENKKQLLSLVLIAAVPVLRFVILSSHVNRHFFFTYRAVLPIIILFNIIIVNIMSKNIKKSLNNGKLN